MQRAAKFHRIKAEAVAQMVRSASQLFELAAPFCFQKIELLIPVRESTQGYTQKANFALHVAVLAKETLKDRENVAVEKRGLGKRLRSRVGVEARVANGQRHCARCQSRFAQALARFLRKVAEHGHQHLGVVRVFAKGMIVRD